MLQYTLTAIKMWQNTSCRTTVDNRSVNTVYNEEKRSFKLYIYGKLSPWGDTCIVGILNICRVSHFQSASVSRHRNTVWAQVHAGRSRRQFSGSFRRVKDFVTVKGIEAPPCFGCPIRMSPELEDDVNRCLLKDERVKWRATQEGLHLETLQVTEPAGWILAQKLCR